MSLFIPKLRDTCPVVADTSARDLRLPNPQVGQRCVVLADNVVQRWTGSAWKADVSLYDPVTHELNPPVSAIHSLGEFVKQWKRLYVLMVVEGHTGTTYGANIPIINGYYGHIIGVTDGNAFTVDNPSQGTLETNARVAIWFQNTSGGAMGVVSWGDKYRLGGALTNPATGKRRGIEFWNDGAVWAETWRSVGDVAIS